MTDHLRHVAPAADPDDIASPISIVLHGPRDALAAAMYLFALSPGQYFDKGGNVYSLSEVDLHLVNEPPVRQEALVALDAPAGNLAWVSPAGRPQQIPLNYACTLAPVHSRRAKACADEPDQRDILVTLHGAGSYDWQMEQINKWSERCPDVAFVTSQFVAARGGRITTVHRNGTLLASQLSNRPNGDLFSCHWGRYGDTAIDLALDDVIGTFLQHHGYDLERRPAPHPMLAAINKSGPDALLNVVNATVDSHSGDRLSSLLTDARLRHQSLSPIDAALITDWDRLFDPVWLPVSGNDAREVHILSSTQFDSQGLYIVPVHSGGTDKRVVPDQFAAMAPRLSLERLHRLASLCAENDALARLIGSEFGRTANGCHVVAFMARAATPGTPQARGVAQVLKSATFELHETEDFESQSGVSRTVGALLASGNPDAWCFLLKHKVPAMLRHEGARCALQVPRDTQAYLDAFGAHDLHRAAVTIDPDSPAGARIAHADEMIKAHARYQEALNAMTLREEAPELTAYRFGDPSPAAPARVRSHRFGTS
jgi:hypothetical protein